MRSGVTDQIGDDLVDAFAPLRCDLLEPLGILALDADDERHATARAGLNDLNIAWVDGGQLIATRVRIRPPSVRPITSRRASSRSRLRRRPEFRAIT